MKAKCINLFLCAKFFCIYQMFTEITILEFYGLTNKTIIFLLMYWRGFVLSFYGSRYILYVERKLPILIDFFLM